MGKTFGNITFGACCDHQSNLSITFLCVLCPVAMKERLVQESEVGAGIAEVLGSWTGALVSLWMEKGSWVAASTWNITGAEEGRGSSSMSDHPLIRHSSGGVCLSFKSQTSRKREVNGNLSKSLLIRLFKEL